MFRIDVSYPNFDEELVTEILYFHMTTKDWLKADQEKRNVGGYEKYLDHSVKSDDPVVIMTALDDIIRRAYGVKADGGRRFVKTVEETEAFMDSLAYDAFLDKLMSSDGLVFQFVKSLLPPKAAEEAGKKMGF